MWAAVTAVAAAYVVRSAIRGCDFRPDLPFDAIALAAFAILVALRLALGRTRSEDEAEAGLTPSRTASPPPRDPPRGP